MFETGLRSFIHVFNVSEVLGLSFGSSELSRASPLEKSRERVIYFIFTNTLKLLKGFVVAVSGP